MRDTELKEQRDRDLFDCYQRVLRERDFRNQQEAIEYVRRCPAPRFYISSKVCSDLLGKIFAGKKLERMHPIAYKRICYLADLYKNFVSGENGKKGLPREHVCELIVDMPAPEFYVSHIYASRIINREIRRHNAEMKRRCAV